MRWAGLALLVAAGCGRIAFHEVAADALARDGDGAIDGGDPSPFSRVRTIKPDDTAAGALFGHALALAANGSVLAVGAPLRGSEAGAVYVFRRSGDTWSQDAILTPSNGEALDQFGWSVAIAADGNTIVAGARREDSATATNENDNTAMSAGAAYVFSYTGTWAQVAYLKGTAIASGNAFGERVAISSDASLIAVGAPGALTASGRAHIFLAGTYAEQAAFTADNVDAGDEFGYRLAVAPTGMAIVGAYREDSSVGGVPVLPGDDNTPNSGAGYAFTRTGDAWSQSVAIKASDLVAGDNFGYGVAMTPSADTVAITAEGAQSARGAVYVYRTSPWTEDAILRASDGAPTDELGYCVTLTDDGKAVASGAIYADTIAPDSGALYLFERGTQWGQTRKLEAPNAGGGDYFGWGCALSATGTVLAVSAPYEDGSGTGIDPANDDSAPDAGAVYVFD